MQLIAVIKIKLPMEQGTTQSGQQWRRQTLLCETISEHPKEVAINFVNTMADVAAREVVGNVVKIQLDAESHEHEGRYYTELRGWQIKPAYQMPAAPAAAPAAPTEPNFDPNGPNDDLPY